MPDSCRFTFEQNTDVADSAAGVFVFSEWGTAGALVKDLAKAFGNPFVRSFDSLAECISEAMDLAPKLVVLDLQAVVSAVNVNLQRLRNDRGCVHLPVLVRAPNVNAWELAQLVHCGASDVVTYSADPARFMTRIRQMLEGQYEAAQLPDKGVFQALQRAQFDRCQSILPDAKRLGRIERHYGLDLSCTFMAPAGSGGDLWDVMPIDPFRLTLFLADFCGHGLHVAPHTLRLAGLMHSQGFDAGDPSHALAWLNDRLHALLPAGQFAAMAYAVIDTRTNSLSIACSAHMPPLIKAPGNRDWTPIDATGLPLGFTKGATFITHRFPFPAGAGLILYSDALVETPLPPKSRFTPESLRDFCSKIPPDTPSQSMNDVLVKALDLKRNKLEDDLTLLTIQRS